ncbi:amidase [Minwuia sp.]|uniref:amidase n=1 Tax=Minwuia sp. TaxID=2493630 RepID=UPI003A93F1CE
MSDLSFKSAIELAADIREGRIGSLEMLNHFIDRVERFDNQLNAVVVRDFERARARATEADAALARGESWGPLHGLPMTVKESFDVAGLPTCWGVPEMKDHVPETDGVAIQRLKAAGVVIFGKTNIPFMLADFQSYNAVYGTTHNPWKHGHTPGGSSGGGAAALAAGMTTLEYGSDIGGSIRNPAHYSGVFGHKPTWGIVPLRGHSLSGALSPTDLSCIGPLARSTDDLELALDLTAGADRPHAGGWKLDLQPGPDSVRGLKVALWLDDPMSEVDERVKARVAAAAQALADAGAEIDDTARPAFDAEDCHGIYMQLLHGALAGRQPDGMFEETLKTLDGLSDDDRSGHAMLVRAQTMRHRTWIQLNEARTAMRWAWADFFDRYDVLLCPTAAVPAFPHDESDDMNARKLTVNGRQVPYFDQLFWAGMIGVSYLPATMYPAGLTDDGLPVGVQIVGPELGDRRTLAVSRMLEQIMGGFQAPPGYE